MAAMVFNPKFKKNKTTYRVNINLTEENYQFLNSISEDTGLSMAEIIRQILDQIKADKRKLKEGQDDD